MSATKSSLHTLVKQNLSRLLIVLVAIVMAGTMYAQIVETGVIIGTVKDNTGALIPNAPVTVRNIGTGLASKISTDAQGFYVSPPLNPGNYTVEIDVSGFGKVIENVRLEVGQRVAADATLTVGANAETVEVQASGELLETETSSVSNLRSEEAVKDLPLNGRNFAELIGLGAGALPAEQQISSVPYTMQRGDTSFAFNGLRYQENRLLLDGIGDNDNHNGLAPEIFPPIEAIQEFSEDIADADARYGRGNGGTINLLFKSGTDKYHGDVFEFLRNSALNARNYFDTTAIKPPLRENQFGITFGGPVFYRQANPKTFFFADFAGSRLGQGQTSITSVPDVTITSAGYDFSAYLPKYAIAIPGTVTSANPTGSPYPGNIVPSTDSHIDPTGAKILSFYQQYSPAKNFLTGKTTVGNYLYTPLRIDDGNAFDVKVDHKFSERDAGFLRYSHSLDTVSQPGILPTPLVGAVICGPATNPANQAVLSETHIFSSNTVNTARYGWTRFFVNAENWDATKNWPTTLGIPGVEIAGNPNSDGLPVYGFSGFTSIGDAGNSPTQIGTNNYQWDDNVNLVRGKHSLDIGFELVRLEYNMFQTGAEHGSETFTGQYSLLPWSDLLFGAPATGSYSFPTEVGLRQSDLSFYVQDNYKVSNKLTLNLGLRYENILGWPWTEVNNKEYDFVPSISTTALEQVGTNGVPRSGLSGNNLNFAPRVGLAYRFTNKTVFHGGYGIYYSAPNVTNSSGLSANVPVDDYWAFSNSNTYGTATNSLPFVYAANGFTHTRVTSGSALQKGTPAFSQDPNARTPYSIQWHAAIEQQIPYSTVIKIAYVGTKGVHLDNLRDINAGPIAAAAAGGPTSVAKNRPFPQFGIINDLETRQISNYDALQVTAERRGHGLNILASYTYSHALDESTGSAGSVTDPFNLRYDYGNSDEDIPNRFVASATYELPFKAKSTLGGFIQGWQLNTILQYYDGFPFTVASSAGNGDGLTPRANFIGTSGNGSLPKGQRTHLAWFNTADFKSAPQGTWGNSGRNILQGPGTKNIDFSVFKNTHLTESKILQLRLETFNLFNTPQFNNPASTAGTASAGIITSAGSEPVFQRLERQLQLAAKITF
jgi:hypothetical protein